jgi:hypothetical protein
VKLSPVDPNSIQMEPRKWYKLDSPEVTECCDCGLVHETEFMLQGGRIFWRSITNAKATEAARKKHGIKITRAETPEPPARKPRRRSK